MIEIFEIKDQEKWDNFVLANHGEFLQSFKWGSFKEKMGDEIWRFGIKDIEEIIGQACLLRHRLIFSKKYFYCPRGPIFLSSLSGDKKKEAIRNFLIDIKNLAKKEKAIFFRFEPNLPLENLNLKEIFSNLKFDYQPLESSTQPKETLVLDLKKEIEDLLKSMHPKTRYNLHLAEKHGVKVSVKDDVKTFLDLLKETAKRQNLKIYSYKYYFNLLKEFPNENIKIYFAYYKNKILAANLILFWGKTATYLYGGSSRENREKMAPYLLHWEIIKEAKQKGFLVYDFWGIDEKKWPGLTRFKLGFGGRRIVYPQSYDLIFNKFWYFLYRLGNKFRKGLTF